MNIIIESSVKSYAAKVENVLIEKEACNNLMLGLINRLKTNRMDCYLGYVEDNGMVVSAFMRTPPHNWIIADVAAANPQVAHGIADHIYEKGMDAPGIIGPVAIAEKFAKRWPALTGSHATIHMHQLIYQLDEVKVEPADTGRLIKATEEQRGLIADWLVQFSEEANETTVADNAETLAHQFVKNRSVYLWQAGNQFVSMVNRSRETNNGATINAVFTPDAFKRKGYATSAVAALSRQLLDEGFQFCSLYTDQNNPTSNRIYQKIGYYEVGSSIVYHFGKGA